MLHRCCTYEDFSRWSWQGATYQLQHTATTSTLSPSLHVCMACGFAFHKAVKMLLFASTSSGEKECLCSHLISAIGTCCSLYISFVWRATGAHFSGFPSVCAVLILFSEEFEEPGLCSCLQRKAVKQKTTAGPWPIFHAFPHAITGKTINLHPSERFPIQTFQSVPLEKYCLATISIVTNSTRKEADKIWQLCWPSGSPLRVPRDPLLGQESDRLPQLVLIPMSCPWKGPTAECVLIY